MSEALKHVLETDKARARAEAAANRPLPTYVRTTVLIIVIAIGVWLLVAPPAWLLPAEPAVPTPSMTARTLAVTMVGRAQEVVAVYRGQGALPASLAEVAPVAENIRYRVTGPAAFELRSGFGDSTLVLPVTIPRTDAPSYELQQTAGFTP